MRNYPRVYTSFMPNAPILNGTPGAWLNILKKCLVGGSDTFDIGSITVASGVATITYNYANQQLLPFNIIVIQGCDEPLLNTTVTIIDGYVGGATFNTTVADGTYTGASGIKASYEPAGWEVMFSGTNQSVLRSLNPDSSKTCVYVDDTNATTCSFEFAYDALSLTNLISPTSDAGTKINYVKCLLKSFNAVAGNYRNWAIVADNSTCYMLTDYSIANPSPITKDIFVGSRLTFFGDFTSSNSFDKNTFGFWFTGIAVGATAQVTSLTGSPQYTGFFGTTIATDNRSGLRSDYNTLTPWNYAFFFSNPSVCNATNYQSGCNSGYGVTSIDDLTQVFRKIPVNGVYYNVNLFAASFGTYIMYGQLPGLRFSDYQIRNFFNNFDIIKSPSGDEVFMLLPISSTNRSSDIIDSSSMGLMPILLNKIWE